MKRLAVALILVLFICTPTLAGYIDGARLVEGWREYQKGQAERPCNAVYAGQYVGYVNGVVDCLDGLVFHIPDNVKMGQIYAIVGKYLDDNPSDWNLNAAVLVGRGLQQVFPKK